MLNKGMDVDLFFDDAILAEVICLQEVCKLWGKSPRQVHWAIDRDHVSARKSITGGTWLINYRSVVLHWGLPEKELEEWMG